METSIKILAIGNSFSVDAMEYLWHVLRAGGVERVILGNLYIPGCPVQLHADNIANDAHTYIYFKNTDGVWLQTPEASLAEGLLDEEWDVVTLQQSSHDSGLPETYARQGEVTDYVLQNSRNPALRLFWHMTWAYQGDSNHWAFPRYGRDQAAMYAAIVRAVKSEVQTRPVYAGIIPSGRAVQALRATPVGDTVTRDGFHLSESHGRYVAALTWARTLCGIDPDTVDWLPAAFADVIRPDLAHIRRAVKQAGDGNEISDN